MKTKVKQTFNFILTLAVMLTMAQTAWAADQTVTYRLITGTQGCIKANIGGTEQNIITPIGNDIRISNDGTITNSSFSHETENLQISANINGKIKQIEFTKIGKRGLTTAFGDTYYWGIDGMKYGNADAVTETGKDEASFTFTSNTGISGNPLIQLGALSSFIINSNCDLVITYEPSAAPVHTHNFSFNAVGNTLTATCGHSDGLACSLADADYKATLTLSSPVDTYYRPYTTYSAKHNLTAFNTLTGLNTTATDITYVNNTTGSNLGSTAPTTAGNYTASVTATIDGTNYTLTTDFKVNTENSINNNIRQISLNKTNAANDEEITITFTPRSHELVNTLTVTGATTDMSIGNGITKVDEYTYTFLMPYEEVTVGATFKSSDASLYKYAITTDITGSGAVDYNAEEYLGAGDAITITFMPYLQGNLEAGSVVLEGLTVTGATTSMSVGNGITDNGDNTYTFTMPGENVTVTAKAYLSADAILAGTINEPIYIKQGNGIQIGCNNIWTYVNDGALPLVIPDGNTLRLAGGTDVRLDLADKNAIACEGDAIVELVPNEVSNEIWIGDRPERNSGKATIKVGPAGKTLTIRVADESTETVHLSVKSISQYDRNCDVIGCDEGGSCGSIVVESGQVESREYFNHSGRAFRTTDGTITFGYKYPDDKIIFDGGSEGTVKIEDGKQFHSYTDNNTKYSGSINLQGINSFYARPDKYTVTFDENGGSDVDNQTVAHGMKATEPATTREGCTFVRWNNGEDAYDFNTVVTSDLTLTAEWTKNVLELANAGDNGDAITTAAGSGKVYEVTLSDRTLYKDGKWNTICLPFDVKIEGSVLDGAVARKLTAATVTDNETIGQTLHLTFGDAVTDSLKAGVPYIIKWEEGDNITDPVFPNVTISNTYEGFDNGVAGDYRVRFLGTYNKMVYGNADKSVLFMGSSNNLYYPDGEEQVTLGACRAYFKIGDDDAVNAKGITGFVIDFGDNEETTGIHNAEVIMQNGNADAWYTVDGIRLSGKPSKKGMYINNGKKVVVE